MRGWQVAVVSIVFSVTAWCQTAQFDDSEQVVHSALTQLSSGVYDAQTERNLHRLGDAVAVAFTKELGGQAPSWTAIENFLLLVHEAFLTPQAIENASDREPRTTLFLLQELGRMPLTLELKRSIADTRTFVQQSPSRL